MSLLLFLVLGFVFVCWLGIVFVGAPYVPTKQRDVATLLKLLKLGKNDLLVDLGSGDGRLLLAGAKQGIHVVGYELNPFLVLISRYRLRKYRTLTQTRTVDFWMTQLPADTTVVFTFLASPFMKRLEKYLQREAARLGHDITFVSYGFSLPNLVAERQENPFVIYKITASV